MYVTSVFSK